MRATEYSVPKSWYEDGPTVENGGLSYEDRRIVNMWDGAGTEVNVYDTGTGFLLELYGYREEDGADSVITATLSEAQADSLAERLQIVLADREAV